MNIRNMMTVDQVMYTIRRVDNHVPVLEYDAVMQELDIKEERMKYKNYSDLSTEEQEKYTPKETR